MRHSLHILIMIAFLGGIIAPACGFAWGGKYSVIEICTVEGIETRVVADSEQPSSPTNHPAANDQCQFCFANSNLTSALPKMASVEAAHFQAEKLRFRLYEVIVLSRATSHEEARGPPAQT